MGNYITERFLAFKQGQKINKCTVVIGIHWLMNYTKLYRKDGDIYTYQ